MKKIESAFEHITFTKRTLRELRILRHMQHENVIDIASIFLPNDRDGFDDIYVRRTGIGVWSEPESPKARI